MTGGRAQPGRGPYEGLRVGDVIELTIGAVAHGGHCVARYEGRVIFVRHALPGEQVLAQVTEARRDSFCRADAVEVLEPAAGRVAAPCVHFRPRGCGGCDFQHATPELQRSLKAAVIAEQLSRLGGIEFPVEVEALPGDGFGWRTRVRWGIDRDGSVGPRVSRSAEVVGLTTAHPCLIAAPGITELALTGPLPRRSAPARTARGPRGRRGRGGAPEAPPEVSLTAAGDGSLHATMVGSTGAAVVHETVHGRRFAVAADGFWQVHPAAASTLVDAVLEYLPPIDGGTVWDLFGGVGLFAAFLAGAVGESGSVVTIESDDPASALAEENLSDLRQVVVREGRVEQLLAGLSGSVDVVVLDPPRSGAGRAVCEAIAQRTPAVIIYVACDPAALGRDTSTLAALGYHLEALRAFDAFPQTHHVECVARFVR